MRSIYFFAVPNVNAPADVVGVPNEKEVAAGAAVVVPAVIEGVPNENDEVLLLDPNEKDVPLVVLAAGVVVPNPGVVGAAVVPENVDVLALGCVAPNANERPEEGCALLGVIAKFMLEPVALVTLAGLD